MIAAPRPWHRDGWRALSLLAVFAAFASHDFALAVNPAMSVDLGVRLNSGWVLGGLVMQLVAVGVAWAADRSWRPAILGLVLFSGAGAAAWLARVPATSDPTFALVLLRFSSIAALALAYALVAEAWGPRAALGLALGLALHAVAQGLAGPLTVQFTWRSVLVIGALTAAVGAVLIVGGGRLLEGEPSPAPRAALSPRTVALAFLGMALAWGFGAAVLQFGYAFVYQRFGASSGLFRLWSLAQIAGAVAGGVAAAWVSRRPAAATFVLCSGAALVAGLACGLASRQDGEVMAKSLILLALLASGFGWPLVFVQLLRDAPSEQRTVRAAAYVLANSLAAAVLLLAFSLIGWAFGGDAAQPIRAEAMGRMWIDFRSGSQGWGLALPLWVTLSFEDAMTATRFLGGLLLLIASGGLLAAWLLLRASGTKLSELATQVVAEMRARIPEPAARPPRPAAPPPTSASARAPRFCVACGMSLMADARFCSGCGASVRAPSAGVAS